MTLRRRLAALEKQIPPDDDLSHLTGQELHERMWQLHRAAKAQFGEEVTQAEEELFRSDPERALVDCGRWALEHCGDEDFELKERYRRLVASQAAWLEERETSKRIRQMILQDYERYKRKESMQ